MASEQIKKYKSSHKEFQNLLDKDKIEKLKKRNY